MNSTLLSERLALVRMTRGFLRASLAGDRDAAERELRLRLPDGWPGEDKDMLALRLRQLDSDPAFEPWVVRAMVLKGTEIMVGHIGFHGAPASGDLQGTFPGAVEFGFTVWAPYRRQGYAREAALTLMGWARRSQGVRRFVLSIRPDNVPSQALAAQLGFQRVGSQLDDVDGWEDVLELVTADGAEVDGLDGQGRLRG